MEFGHENSTGSLLVFGRENTRPKTQKKTAGRWLHLQRIFSGKTSSERRRRNAPPIANSQPTAKGVLRAEYRPWPFGQIFWTTLRPAPRAFPAIKLRFRYARLPGMLLSATAGSLSKKLQPLAAVGCNWRVLKQVARRRIKRRFKLNFAP
jgi:hypothetical protein